MKITPAEREVDQNYHKDRHVEDQHERCDPEFCLKKRPSTFSILDLDRVKRTLWIFQSRRST